ncbi:MAG TPA: ATP-binding protein [Rubrivivax sp.]|nr:ATP-binding protein [Rubrivivax sp.]
MRALYLRIYLTVVLALALFALVSGWLLQHHIDQERERFVASAQERTAAWAELLQRSLPGAEAPAGEQAAALADWSVRLRLPLALDDAQGRRIGASDSYLEREADADAPGPRRAQAVQLEDGRTLWLMRPGRAAGPPGHTAMGGGMHPGRAGPPGLRPPRVEPQALGWWPLPLAPGGLGLAALLLVLFAAIAAGAWPVVRRLTRRLEALKRGVEAFGAGALHQRVAEDGRDEVAALGASFNQAAARIEALLHSHQSLLANASHELRSPLARLKMAVAMLEDAPPAQREGLKREIGANIGELDALVDEVLLASRLDAGAALPRKTAVDLLALAAEEAARVQAGVEGQPLQVAGDERLLRRALRNLLENARRYGGGEVEVEVRRAAAGQAEVRISDRGPGVPEAYRERIFEAFFRLPGHAEREGGVGLGLALVRQIAQAHGGSVHCDARDGGGSRFSLVLPAG